jgi:hypothetical protein
MAAEELDEVRRGLQFAADDERTLFCSPRFFQAWGHRPN